MLISCPECKTTFAVPIKAIGVTGRKVKCSKCTHVWFQEPAQVDRAALENLLSVDAEESINLPARRKQKFSYAYVACLFLLLLCAAGIQLLKQPGIYPPLGAKLQLTNYNGLRFHDFSVESHRVDNKLDFFLRGKVINTTSRTRNLPPMNVRVYSKGGRIMAESRIRIPQDQIGPFGEIFIDPEITTVSGNADKIELSFENWAEGALR